MSAPRTRRFASAQQRRQVWRGRWLALPAILRHVLTAVCAALLVLMLVSIVFRGSMSSWLWPDSHSEELQARADAALREGRLTSEDGNGAR